MKILVIEDNMAISRNIARFFSLQDIQTDICLDWNSGLYKASLNFYDAIILDLNLPWINWYEICKQLKEN